MIFHYASELLLGDNYREKYDLYATISASVSKNISFVVNGTI